MNLSHLKTIFWLRWRLLINQFHRMSKANRIATAIILVLALVGSAVSFFVGWLGSGFLFSKVFPELLMLIWSALAVGFLFAWGIGVLTDLQRSEPLALDKFLHLPVSPRGAFISNFLSSFLSISMILMFPVLFGICLGMIKNMGWHMAPGVLLFLSFIFLVVAATYQLRGWLASLMVNPKQRRFVIAVFTLLFVLVTQIPNILNLTVFETRRKESEQIKQEQIAQVKEWKEAVEKGEMTEDAFERRRAAQKQDEKLRFRADVSEMAAWTRGANVVLPVGWMALGIEMLAEKQFFWPFLCMFGMTALGLLSLRRSYATTLKMYRGETTGDLPPVPSTSGPSNASSANDDGSLRLTSWFDRTFPLLNERQSTVFAAMFSGVMRAPEAKLALLSPFLIMVVMGVSFAFRDAASMPNLIRSITGIGVGCFALMGVLQILNNQFGYDRSGFRTLMLTPAPRRDILIGKNAALALPTLVMGALGIVLAQIFVPMKTTHFLASFFQMGTLFLATCLIGNLLSIRCPIGVASGSMKPVNMKLGVVLLQILSALAIPLISLPLMGLPLLEYALVEWFNCPPLPIYLVLAIIVFFLMFATYLFVVRRQADLFREHEQEILAVVGEVVG